MFAASFKDDMYQKDHSDSPAHRIIKDNNIVTASSYDFGASLLHNNGWPKHASSHQRVW